MTPSLFRVAAAFTAGWTVSDAMALPSITYNRGRRHGAMMKTTGYGFSC